MQFIRLPQRQIAILDDEDFQRLAHFHWTYRAERHGNQGYAMRRLKVDGKYKTRYLHRDIADPPVGMTVIFLNHDRLDCRKENLKVVTPQTASHHHRVRSDCKSGFQGVKHNPENGTYSANLYRDDRCHCLGSFSTPEAAAHARQCELEKWEPELFTATAPPRIDRATLPLDDPEWQAQANPR